MNTVNQEDWERYIRRFPDVHVLQTGIWGEAKAAFGWSVSRIAGETGGAQILFNSLPFGFCWGYIPRGPVGDPEDEVWNKVDLICRRKRAVLLKIEPDLSNGKEQRGTNLPDRSRLRRSLHTIQPRRTLIVDLIGDEDDLLSRMKQKTRYNIRLSSRKGVTVRSGNEVGEFFKLLEITGQRDEFGIHSESYYQKVFELFAPQDACRMILATYEGKLLSAAMVFTYGTRCWYFYGASSNEHRNLMAPYAVQWEAMRWARSKGCQEYDLWGVPDEDLETLEAEFTERTDGLWGVYRFKRGFGGSLKRTPGAWDVVYHPLLYRIYLEWVKYKGF
jgi:lipid II:glycine glycyltransferase (peptidoglycan interpeptide bridge formation enzyme)